MRNLVVRIGIGGGASAQRGAVIYFNCINFSILSSDDLRDARFLKGERNMDIGEELKTELTFKMQMQKDIYLDSDCSTLKHQLWLRWIAKRYGYRLSFCMLRQTMSGLVEEAGCDFDALVQFGKYIPSHLAPSIEAPEYYKRHWADEFKDYPMGGRRASAVFVHELLAFTAISSPRRRFKLGQVKGSTESHIFPLSTYLINNVVGQKSFALSLEDDHWR